jgi:hypothetical protein
VFVIGAEVEGAESPQVTYKAGIWGANCDISATPGKLLGVDVS